MIKKELSKILIVYQYMLCYLTQGNIVIFVIYLDK